MDNRILANLIQEKASTVPDLDVLTFVDILPSGEFTDEVRTYKKLWDKGQQVCRGLLAENMEAGESFALVMQNHAEFVDCMVGSSLAATIFVPIDPRTQANKLVYMMGLADCKGVICADYCLTQIMEACEILPDIRWIWVLPTGELTSLPENRTNTDIDGAQIKWFADGVSNEGEDQPCRVKSADEIMQLLFTSGTTGDPKAIQAPYNRYDNVASIGPSIGFQLNDRPYTGLSLTHANAQLISLGNILKMGLRGVVSRKFSKSRLWDICRHYQCTTFNLLGGMTTAIYSEPAKGSDRDHPVRFILSAGMPASIWNDFSERFDVELFEIYAAAEGGLLLNPPGVGPVGSIGKPPPSLEAKIIDENGKECAVGQRGEIVFRSLDETPSLTVEYYKNPKASDKKVQNGVLYMGDIGHLDQEGWFYFDSRKGDEIRRNGEFIDITLIEKVIAEHGDVADVFVYGIPAENGVPGEKDVVAAVVPVDSVCFEPSSLSHYCSQKLSKSELPSFIQVMSEIPKTASEKPQARFCYEAFVEQKNHVYAFNR